MLLRQLRDESTPEIKDFDANMVRFQSQTPHQRSLLSLQPNHVHGNSVFTKIHVKYVVPEKN